MKNRVSMNVVDNDLKAHIYQQVALLEPQLGIGSQVAVLLRQEPLSEGSEGNETDTESLYVVELQVEVDREKLQIEASNTTPYLAMTSARQHMQAVLAELLSMGEKGEQRSSVIHSIINNDLLH
jgi:ribosome-associated translation inhibitor RaiA